MILFVIVFRFQSSSTLSVWTISLFFRKQAIRFPLIIMALFSAYIDANRSANSWKYIPVLIELDGLNIWNISLCSQFPPYHFERGAKSFSMVEKEKPPGEAPDNSPVPPKFPGQTYRDRDLSPNSEDDSYKDPKSNSSYLLYAQCVPMMLTGGHRTRSQETRRSKPVSRAPSRDSFRRQSPTGNEPTGLKIRICARCFSTWHVPLGLTASASRST